MSSTTTLKLFSPFILGTIILRHRVVMAPLTRLRSDQPGDIPEDLMAEYYAQRASPVAAAGLRKIFKGPIIAAGGFDREGAIKIVENGDADLVAFGRQFISNPDLPERFRLGIPLNPYNRATFYSTGPEG